MSVDKQYTQEQVEAAMRTAQAGNDTPNVIWTTGEIYYKYTGIKLEELPLESETAPVYRTQDGTVVIVASRRKKG